MSRALIALLLLATTGITTAAELRSKDLVGLWTLRAAGKNYGRYTFWGNSTYTGYQGDALFLGTWKLLDHGRKLQLTLGGGVPRHELTGPPRREVVAIDSFNRNTLRVTVPDGKKNIWKKMPRSKGSPDYSKPTADDKWGL